mgnify:CR=1 FL=1
MWRCITQVRTGLRVMSCWQAAPFCLQTCAAHTRRAHLCTPRVPEVAPARPRQPPRRRRRAAADGGGPRAQPQRRGRRRRRRRCARPGWEWRGARALWQGAGVASARRAGLQLCSFNGFASKVLCTFRFASSGMMDALMVQSQALTSQHTRPIVANCSAPPLCRRAELSDPYLADALIRLDLGGNPQLGAALRAAPLPRMARLRALSLGSSGVTEWPLPPGGGALPALQTLDLRGGYA